jgi:hypothetical protein
MREENLYAGASADGRLCLSGNFGHVHAGEFNRLSEADRLRAIGRALLSAASFRGKAFDSALASEGRAVDSFIDPRGEEDGPTVIDVLKELRPIVARSKDSALREAFNALLGRYTRSKALDGGPAHARRIEPGQRYAELQAAYDSIRMGEKQEVL